jgi:hypothetical protein
MAKQKPDVSIRSYGIYSKWDSDTKDLPSFLESTTRIPAQIDVEFGLMVHIKGGKNLPISYCIDHPGILDGSGKPRPPFQDVVYIKTNDWDFYLGDTVWEPIEDKIGSWRMTLKLQGVIVADKTFELYQAARPFRHQYRLLWVPGLGD